MNHDGRLDVVIAGWMTNGIFWWENPGKLGAEWKRHFIADSYETEDGWMCMWTGKPRRTLNRSHFHAWGL